MTDKLEFTLGSRIIYNVDADHIQNIRNADEDVIKLKSTFKDLINQFDEIRSKSESWDVKRLASITISKLEEACMFGVKTITYNK